MDRDEQDCYSEHSALLWSTWMEHQNESINRGVPLGPPRTAPDKLVKQKKEQSLCSKLFLQDPESTRKSPICILYMTRHHVPGTSLKSMGFHCFIQAHGCLFRELAWEGMDFVLRDLIITSSLNLLTNALIMTSFRQMIWRWQFYSVIALKPGHFSDIKSAALCSTGTAPSFQERQFRLCRTVIDQSTINKQAISLVKCLCWRWTALCCSSQWLQGSIAGKQRCEKFIADAQEAMQLMSGIQ